MQIIEKSSQGTFEYTRYRHDSKSLGREVNYGVLRFKDSPSKPDGTVYFLHGGNGDDRQAVEYQLLGLLSPRELDALRKKNYQIALPFVGTSFLHDHGADKGRAFSTYFLKELMVKIEKDTQTTSKSRFLSGLSMGGQAALSVFFKFPKRFAGVGVHFATLVKFNYLNAKEVSEFAKRTSIGKDALEILISGFQSEFSDHQDFAKHDPIELASRIKAEKVRGKRIYFDVGSDDDFGLAEGAELLHEKLRVKKIDHFFEIVPGGKHNIALVNARFAKMISYLLSI